MEPILKEGEIRTAGNWQIRNFKGYQQSREGNSGLWKFYVTDFDSSTSGQDGYCNVLMNGGIRDTVRIDSKNRITIHGKKYGESHWNH